MFKKISYFLFLIFKILDRITILTFKKSFLHWFKQFIHQESYIKIDILNKKTIFFIPNHYTEWRVNNFLTKEPETIDWINSFDNSKKFSMWDIGSNIGTFSIYTAMKHDNAEIISFEPSTSNLRVLTRNISINKLEDRIKVITFPLIDKKNQFLMMNEGEFEEGGSHNNYGLNTDYEGKNFLPEMKYNVFGTNINDLLENKIINIPNYIKIDVDGIEHLILLGADKFLNHKNLVSLSIEINEDYQEQYNSVLKIMNKNNFKILHKKHNEHLFDKTSKFSNTYNYIFIKK